jgi:RecA/RadA recombinase
MVKPFDISKFRKSITKSIPGMSAGFHDPTDWISTGNYALNYLISGDFFKGVPLGKVTVFAGESGCLPETAIVKIKYKDIANQFVNVGKLKKLVETSSEIEIDTPDGFQKITAWFDKGVLPMIKITTNAGLITTCATNHLLQSVNDQWILAENVAVDMQLLTLKGLDIVKSVETVEPMECYDFTVDHDNHRYWGDGFSSHNSGKSYICSGNIIKNAQEQGIFVILVDSENALDSTWLENLGVDTSEDKLLKLNMAMIDDVAKMISTFMTDYKAMNEEDRPKVLFVLDSLGMLLDPASTKQFADGDLKGDFGRKPKALKALVTNCVNQFASYGVGLLATNHTYVNQDQWEIDQVVSGGAGFVFASSILVLMRKLKLKVDEDGEKTKEVNGIRSICKVVKSRYSKPFEEVSLQIPYYEGMSPYSGLFDLFEKTNLTKEGNRYVYTDLSGAPHKYFRKQWGKNENGIFDLVMTEFSEQKARNPQLTKMIVDESEEIPVED